jgi:hypothetical protein
MAKAKRKVPAKKRLPVAKSQKRLFTSAPTVGIVSSINFADFETSFYAGLRASGWEPAGNSPTVKIQQVIAGANYGQIDLSNLNQNADVIIAVGGLPAAASVQSNSLIPFLVLVGSASAIDLDPHSKINRGLLRGGINLGNPELNPMRNADLCGHFGVQPNDVCLIHNPNNQKLETLELKDWKKTGGMPNGWPDEPGAKGGNNDKNYFPTALANAAKKADAVVISSDPFFTAARSWLVDAVNNSGLFACYPFQFYGTAFPTPDPYNSIWRGPDLQAEYRNLGSKTGTLLHDPTQFLNVDVAASQIGNFS